MSAELKRAFTELYGAAPTHVVRAPGRINLMGDHIDYLGLPVLPMAVQRSIRIALQPRDDDVVRVGNLDPRFRPVQFTISDAGEASASGAWDNYLRAGIITALRDHGYAQRGCDALVASDLPIASGLSSSSALVVAASLMILAANDLDFDRIQLAEDLAHGERFVGTEGGGMDQAISLCAREGCALRIDFEPLQVEPIPLPPDWRFLVASSLEESHKSADVREAYNERSRSARAALATTAPAMSGRELLALLRADPEQLESAARHNPRLRHVLSEATRVVQAIAMLRTGNAAGFGALMTESHESLRDDYEVSTLALDRIVEISSTAGALGARLTGAGFGGSAIVLCTPDTVARVHDELMRQFYRDSSHAMFIAEASARARVTRS